MSTAVGAHRYLDPRALAALRDLSLVARTVVDGLMLGAHTSHRAGAGLEFSQFRSYQPGDDLRRVDWKLYGRSDRFFIREAEAETSLSVRLVLDATASMAHREPAALATFEYARFLVAALALLAQRQGDAVGLYALAGGGLEHLPPSRQPQHLHRLLHRLEALEPAGTWPDWDRIEAALSADTSRGIVVFVSDLHERHDEIRRAARRLAAARHDVLVLHLLGRSELDFPWHGSTLFEEAETGRRIELDADAARAAYQDGVEQELRALRRDLEERRIGYDLVVTDEPLDHALRRFLTTRARQG